MREANLVTDSESSLASITASLSRESAPIGVFSSCEIFATKSRRTSCTRCASLSSRNITKTSSPCESGITFTVISRLPSPIGPRAISIVPVCLIFVRRTTRIDARSSSLWIRPSRSIPSFSASRLAKIAISPGAIIRLAPSNWFRVLSKSIGRSRLSSVFILFSRRHMWKA